MFAYAMKITAPVYMTEARVQNGTGSGSKVPDYTVARGGRIIHQEVLRRHLCNRPVRLLPVHRSAFATMVGLQDKILV